MTPGQQGRDRRLLAGPEILEAEDLPQSPACLVDGLSRRRHQPHRLLDRRFSQQGSF